MLVVALMLRHYGFPGILSEPLIESTQSLFGSAFKVDETSRQEYLASMGIQSYFPRFVLPGAAPSGQCDIPAPEPGPSPQEVPQKTTAPRPAQKPPQTVAKQSEEDSLTAAERAETDELHVQIAFIGVAEGLFALASVPYMQGGGGLNQSQRQLFNNISLCLSLNSRPLNFEIKPFRWPFSEAAHIDKSEAAARTALNAYLSQLQDEHGFNRILVLGEQIAKLLQDGEELDILSSRSLDEMLKMPQLKREVWLSLKTRLRQ